MNINSLLNAFTVTERKSMFGKDLVYDITREYTTEEIKKKCIEYMSYECPFRIGDIIEDECGQRYVVTCDYTDGTIDVVYETGKQTRANVNPYGYDLKKVGALNYEER